MLTGKQKRYLRALGSTMDAIVHIGKGGLSDNLITQLEDALEARELVKVKILNNCLLELDEVAETLAEQTKAVIAQKIGSNILFYRPSKEKPQITLP